VEANKKADNFCSLGLCTIENDYFKDRSGMYPSGASIQPALGETMYREECYWNSKFSHQMYAEKQTICGVARNETIEGHDNGISSI